jgi:hypothetical protein
MRGDILLRLLDVAGRHLLVVVLGVGILRVVHNSGFKARFIYDN